MATMGNNFNARNDQLKNSFFTPEEQEYFNELMKDPDEKSIHDKLLREDANILCEMVMDLIKRVEQGEFNEKQMEYVERCIAQLLGAVEDAEAILDKADDFERQ